MTDQPLVTIAISCYNHARYIEACIDSVLAQRYPALELIVIDDGSVDESPAILRRLAGRHGFHFEEQTNQGLSRTLNRILAMARGEYFCAFGSDDIMLPEKTALQVDYLQAHPEVAVCGGNILCIDEHGELVERQRSYPQRVLDFDDIFLDRQPGITAPTAMIRSEVLRRLGGYDPEIPLEDFALWLKITHAGHRIAVLEDVVAHYRKHAANTYRNLRVMHENIMRSYAPYREHPRYREVLQRHLLRTFVRAARTDQPDLARELLPRIHPSVYGGKFLRGCFHYLRAEARQRLVGRGG